MKHCFRLGSVALQRYRVGPLAPYIDRFATRLSEQQYCQETARHKLRVVADFSVWLQRNRLALDHMNECVVARFFHCRKRRDARHGNASSVRLMLDVLRELGVVVGRPPEQTIRPVHPIEQRFERYLIQERRLSSASVLNTLPFVRRFLTESFATEPGSLDELRPSDVTRFVLRHAHTVSPGRAKLLVGALRSFFRFLRLQGEIATDLAGAVPTVPDWRLSSLPKSIDPAQVRRLLRSCDRRTPTGRRDYAILLLLARLGLRAGEVATLALDDIDWEAGEITVRGKGSRVDKLPMPQDVGRALVAYLRRGRPRCATRRIFLTAKAPVREFANHKAVGCVVRRHLRRVGLNPARGGAHLLRHSLATHMLQRGASLTEIGQVLRHQHPDTTAIYAKVDLDALRDLAHPWPGGAS